MPIRSEKSDKDREVKLKKDKVMYHGVIKRHYFKLGEGKTGASGFSQFELEKNTPGQKNSDIEIKRKKVGLHKPKK